MTVSVDSTTKENVTASGITKGMLIRDDKLYYKFSNSNSVEKESSCDVEISGDYNDFLCESESHPVLISVSSDLKHATLTSGGFGRAITHVMDCVSL